MAVRDIVQAAAGVGGAEKIYVEDVFSTYLYTGNGGTQSINNGIALSNLVPTGFTTVLGDAVKSGDGLTATNTSSSTWYGSSWMTIPSYKCYFRVTENVSNNFANVGLFSSTWDGFLQDAAKPFVAHRSSESTFNGSAGGTPGGSWSLATTNVGVTYNSAGSQAYWDFAVDKANGRAWIRVNGGSWIGGGDPAAGSSPTISNAFDINYLGVGTYQSSQSFTLTDPSSLTPPSGFTAIGGRVVDSEITEYGGLVWIKERANASAHALVDTAQGKTKLLSSNTTAGADTTTAMDSFNADGFTVKYPNTNDYYVNRSGQTYASWTFRKAEKFFDVVTFVAGSSTDRRISHSLGSVPGFWILKAIDLSGMNWPCYHTSLGLNNAIDLNLTGAASPGSNRWGSAPTSTTLGINEANMCVAGYTYVLYIFAHDAGGFGDNGDQSVIKCGSFTHNGTSTAVNLGWEPQWLLLKRTDSAGTYWELYDNMRGFGVGSVLYYLYPNANFAETSNARGGVTATGVTWDSGLSSGDYIYIAIRRGPMKTPESATSVFAPIVGSSLTSSFVTDFAFIDYKPGGSGTYPFSCARLTGNTYLKTSATSAELPMGSALYGAVQNGIGNAYFDSNFVGWLFQRAPGFFDVVCYTGNGSSNTSITHNLGVAPEFMIIKGRSNASSYWAVWTNNLGGIDNYLWLNTNEQKNESGTGFYLFGSSSPTSTTFNVGTNGTTIHTNKSGDTYVAYLFATVAGVSKVGSYTGTGTTLQVNCGFTAGARFVLIKRTDSTGDWYVWDSARGIVAGNDPYLLLNSTAAEVTNTDYVDTYNAGFEITSTAPATINANGGTFIYLAIA